jgi:hypothetical protein
MYEKILPEKTRENLELLKGFDFLKDFYLAGGTGCSIWFEHRISKDLDFFSSINFVPSKLRDTLREKGKLTVENIGEGTFTGEFNGTMMSFFHYPYPLIEKKKEYRGLYIAHWSDIACMKIDSISSRGKKRDFIDLYITIKKGEVSLENILALFRRKYRDVHFNLVHIIKSFSFFKDADNDPMPEMLIEIDWKEVKEFFITESKKILTDKVC